MTTRRSFLSALLALPVLGSPAVRAEPPGVRVSVDKQQNSTTLTVAAGRHPLDWKAFRLEEPDRLVMDLPGVQPQDLQAPLERQLANSVQVAGVRAATNRPGVARLVLSLRAGVAHSVTNLVGEAGLRVVLTGSSKPGGGAPASGPLVTVALDAGHGGKDPGAVGKRGTLEKDVALAVARLLKAEIDSIPGMRAALVRDSDLFMPLAERVRRARSLRADLFLSIHADAAPRREAAGASVYALSETGATSVAARLLAKKENAADLTAGVRMDAADPFLRSTLIDLVQTATMASSVRMGELVLSALERAGKLHKTSVEQAGFAVLKAPDIPSILVETGFLSNPEDEARLADPAYHRVLARAIASGVAAHGQATARARPHQTAG